MGLYDDFRCSAEANKNIVALTYFGVPIRYGELLSRIDETAQAFESRGIRPGDIVALALPTTPESIICLYALNRIGAIVSTIDVRLNGEALMNIVNRLNAKMLFIMSFNLETVASFANKICAEKIVVMRGIESIPQGVAFWYKFGEYFNGRKIQFLKSKKLSHWSDFIKASQKITKSNLYNWGFNECALLFQTSGTTGGAKTVMISNDNLRNAWDSVSENYFDLKSGDKSLCLLPIFAWTGFSVSVHLPLFLGMTVTIVPIWKARDFVKLLARHQPQMVFTTPGMWNIAQDYRKIDLSCLKHVIIGGDILQPIFERKINDFLNKYGCRHEITKMYGMTETCGVVACTPTFYKNKYKLGYAGIVVKSMNVQIIDNEICVLACPQRRFLGYYNDPEETAKIYQLHDDGEYWIHTGDTGYFDENRHLYITGRKKRMIVSHNGSKLFPIEIEAILLKHPMVANCAVVAIEDTEYPSGDLPKAFVQVRNSSSKITESKLKQYCKQHLPERLRPTEIVILKQIPTNNNGKTDYAALQKM